MKKLISIILFLALLTCTTSCTILSGSGNTPDTPNIDPSDTQTIYERLCEMADKSYASVKLKIVTTTATAEISANYVLTKTDVTYSIEQLNTLPTDGNITGVSSNFKTEFSGTAKVENGKLITVDGDNVSFPSYSELKGSFSFNEENFRNAVVGNGSFKADVISPSAFYGTSIDAKEMSIDVTFSDDSLIRVTVTYKTENASVKTVYDFAS